MLILCLDFLIQGGILPSQMRVFTIIIDQVYALMMDIAATVVLSRLTPRRKNLPLAFHPGFMFFKSTKSSSCRTQVASIAYLEEPCTKKVRHHHNRHAKRTYKKQNQLLTEVVVPAHIQNNLLTNHDVEKDILVFDGRDSINLLIKPPNGVDWR
jgi:hypothetical protein